MKNITRKNLTILIILVSAIVIFAQQSGLTRYPNNPIVPMGASGSIDDDKTGPRVVLKFSDTDYRMYYEAVPAPNDSFVGYATSTDGKTWNKQGRIVSLDPSEPWEGGLTGEVSPNTILIENGVWKLWYHSYGNDGKRRIGYATSPDGFNWVKNPNPVLDVGAAGSLEDQHVTEPRVFNLGAEYRMYYTANEAIDSSIGTARWFYATSSDGINWTRRGLIWQKKTDNGFGIVFDGVIWHAWYGLAFQSVNYASSTDGLNWTDGASNPVLLTDSNPASPESGGIGDSVSAYKDGNEFRVMFTGGRYNSFGRSEAICLATISSVPPPTPTPTPTPTATPTPTPTPTPAPSYTISGKVRLSNGVGIANATVYLEKAGTPTRTTLTNSLGNYSFGNVPTGSYWMTATAPGYWFMHRSVNITRNTTVNLTPGGTAAFQWVDIFLGKDLIAYL